MAVNISLQNLRNQIMMVDITFNFVTRGRIRLISCSFIVCFLMNTIKQFSPVLTWMHVSTRWREEKRFQDCLFEGLMEISIRLLTCHSFWI